MLVLPVPGAACRLISRVNVIPTASGAYAVTPELPWTQVVRVFELAGAYRNHIDADS